MIENVQLQPFVWQMPGEPVHPPSVAPPPPIEEMTLPDPDKALGTMVAAPRAPTELVPAAPAYGMFGSEPSTTGGAGSEIVDPESRMTAAQISELAWDVTLFSDSGVDKIVATYDIDGETFARLRQTPLFKAEEAHALKALKGDPHLPVRRMAKAYLMQRLATVNELAVSDLVEPVARLKAINLLQEISGLNTKPDANAGRTGTTVQINFGAALGSLLTKAIDTDNIVDLDNT